MKILFLSRWFPYPVNNGSKLRLYNLLRGLKQHHDVTLLSFIDQAWEDPDKFDVREICSDVKVVPWREFNPRGGRALWGVFSLKPRSIIDTFSPKMADMVAEIMI